MMKVKTFTCACGKVHVFRGQPIYCNGPGHSVYLSPEWWTYGKEKEEEKPKTNDNQITLF